MSSENNVGRRKAILAAGAAGLGLMGICPANALASKFERLDKSIESMRDAKKFLEDAKNRFGGHKKKAIEALTTAIDEIEQAIKFAEK